MSEISFSLPVLDRIAAALEKIAAGMATPAAAKPAANEAPTSTTTAPIKESPIKMTLENVCPACDAVLTPENSSRLASNKQLVHIGCPKAKTEKPQVVAEANSSKTAPAKALKAAPAEVKAANPEPAAAPSVVEVPIEDVRKAMVEFSKAHDRADLVALLAKFSAGKLAEVKPADYAALLEALRG